MPIFKLELSGSGTVDSDLIHGYIESVAITRSSATTLDIDEVSGLQRKIVDLASADTDPTLYPRAEETDITGTGVSTYTRFYVDGKVRMTATAACTAIISMSYYS